MTQEQQKILVIKLGALGDFIQALGPMAAIREHHKNAHITLLTTKGFQGFAEECGYFDDVIIDKRPKAANILGWISLRKTLNKSHFLRVYDLQNNDRTTMYFKLFAAPKPEWSGVAPGASHRNTSQERTAGHAFDGHVQTLTLAGIKKVKIDRLEWMKGDLSTFALKEPYVLLVPGSAPERPEKRWPAEKYGRFAKLIHSMGYQPVLLGTQAEADATQKIAAACPEALDLTGRTNLHQIATLGRNAAAAIGNDTGPMHLIGATSCPSLVLFSKHSNPVRHAPKGENVNVIQKEDLADLKGEEVLQHFKPREEPTKQSSTMH